MVSKNIIEIILRAKDEASEAAKKAEDALRKAGDTANNSFRGAETATKAFEKAVTKVNNTVNTLSEKFQGVSNKIIEQLQNAQIKVRNFAEEFAKSHPHIKNTAETIKNNIETAMEHVKSKIKSLTSNDTFQSLANQAKNSFNKIKNTANNTITSVKGGLKALSLIKPSIIIKGNTQPFDASRMHVYSALQDLVRMDVKIPIGNIDQAAEVIGRINAAFDKVHTSAVRVGETFSSVTGRIRTSISSATTKLGEFSNSLGRSALKMKELANSARSMGQGFTLLKGVLSNVIGMIGYDLVNNMIEGARATINAKGNIEAFSKRLGMTSQEVQNFNSDISKLQQEFRKVDMQSVGASALELANRLQVPHDKIGDLSKMIAVMSSAFVREGRTSEDAILGVADALDGQFKRLQEIGITQDTLKKNGWNGHVEDTASLIDALNKSMEELGITETARQVTNLDDAWQVLNVAMSHLLTDIIVPLTPLLVGLIMAFSDLAGAIGEWWNAVPDGAKLALLGAILGALAAIIYGLVIEAIGELAASITALIVEATLAGTSITAMIPPFVIVAAVVAAAVLVIYELGKAMGWWTDGASAMQVVGEALRNVFNQIVACLQTVYNGFMEVASPVITEFWTYLQAVVAPLQGAFTYLQDTLSRVGDAFGGASGSGKLFADIGRLLGTIFTGLIKHIEILAAVIVPTIKFIINAIADLINFVVDLAQAFSLLLDGDIIGFLEGLGGAIFTLVQNLATHVGQALVSIGHNLLAVLGQSFPALAEAVKGEMDNIVNAITGSVGGIVDAICELGGQIWEWFLNKLGIHSPGIMANAIRDEMGHIAEFILNAIPNAIQAIVRFGMELLAKFRDFITQIPELVSSIFGEGAGQIAEVIIGFIVPCIDTLMMILGDFMVYLDQIRQAVELLMQGDYEGFFNLLITAITNFVLNVGVYITELVTYIWNYGSQIRDYVIQVAYDMVMGFLTWLSTLPGQAWNWLMQTLTNLWNWGTQMRSQIIQTAMNMVNGFISWISTLPGKTWTWLWNVILKVISWASSLLSNVKSAAKGAVDGFKEKLDLKKIVQDEINYIADCLEKGVGFLADKARELAKNIWNAFKNETDQHSPGRIARVIIGEVGYIEEALTENNDKLSNEARETASSIINGFQNNDFSQLTADITPNVDVNANVSEVSVPQVATPQVQMQPLIDPTQNQEINSQVMEQNNQLTNAIAQNSQLINTSLQSTMTTINTLSTTSTNATLIISNNNTKIIQSYNTMVGQVNNLLTTVINNNVKGWNSVKTTTESNLNSILSSTKNVTTQMIQAWEHMKTSIVKAADNIKNESTNRFNNLWSTIKTFYHNIQHPGGAGPSDARRPRSTVGKGFSSIGSALSTGLSNVIRPTQQRLTSNQMSSMGIRTEAIQYMLPQTRDGLSVKTEDVMKFLENGGAGWDGVAKPNNDFIKNKSREWNVAGPMILGKYSTGLDTFKVKDFENGTPTISYETFKKMAEAVFSQCNYLFYMNSEHYGSWQAAANAGLMNCSDSTDFLLALAHACGLSGSKVHGHWNNIGHFWAEIEGHKLDTTGWMLHRNWTPAQSHAGPSTTGLETDDTDSKILDTLKEILTTTKQEKETIVQTIVEHTGDLKLTIEHIIKGEFPQGVSKEEVANILSEKITDRNIIKQLTSNNDFQYLDRRYKDRINKAEGRFS